MPLQSLTLILLLLSTTAAAEHLPITPNDFEGSDVERINQAIVMGAETGRRVVIPRQNRAQDQPPRDVWLLDSAILVRSGTMLVLENCHIREFARDSRRISQQMLGISVMQASSNRLHQICR